MAAMACISLRGCGYAGDGRTRNSTAQRIHLFQVLMSTPAKTLFRFLCASVLIVLLAAGLNFVVDPLQLFRPARFYPAIYSSDSRMQNAGLIRSQDFDTIFMGTSLAVHFRQSDIDRYLGVHSVKLATAGSTSVEQNFT